MYYKFSIYNPLYLHAKVTTVFERRIKVLGYTAHYHYHNFSHTTHCTIGYCVWCDGAIFCFN